MRNVRVTAVVKFQEGASLAGMSYRQRTFASRAKARAFARRVLSHGLVYYSQFKGEEFEHFVSPSRVLRVSLARRRK